MISSVSGMAPASGALADHEAPEWVLTMRRNTQLSRSTRRTVYKQASIASVNRELAKTRKILMSRCTKKWVFDNPFKTRAGKQLNQIATEQRAAEHVWSDAEEQPVFKVVHKGNGRHPVPAALISSK